MVESIPLISVIMSTYKESEELLRMSINSILNQTFSDFEFIIILDNPNNHEHIEIINNYCKFDNRIRFFINEKNLGLSKSLNRAIKLSKGSYICRMDADDIALEKRLEKQLNYLKENNYDLIGSCTEMIKENGETIYRITKVPSDFNKIVKILKYNQCIAHPTWFGKRKVFTDLNGYREIPLCEDYDFTLRAILKGYKISNINEILLKYRMSEGSISRSNLFSQFLYAKYITSMYKKGKVANIEKANAYVKRNFSEKKSQHYSKANIYFNHMLMNIQKKEYISFVINGLLIIFTSKKFLEKIYRFFMVTINS
ncbi:MAG: glycosyltransferase [Beduini sp.]